MNDFGVFWLTMTENESIIVIMINKFLSFEWMFIVIYRYILRILYYLYIKNNNLWSVIYVS